MRWWPAFQTLAAYYLEGRVLVYARVVFKSVSSEMFLVEFELIIMGGYSRDLKMVSARGLSH